MGKHKKLVKEQKKYQNLQERYKEINDYLIDLNRGKRANPKRFEIYE